MSKAQRIFFIGTSNVLNLVIEVMPEKFLNYLPVAVITNLLFVSKCTRQLIFKKFRDIYYLSTGLLPRNIGFLQLKKQLMTYVKE